MAEENKKKGGGKALATYRKGQRLREGHHNTSKRLEMMGGVKLTQGTIRQHIGKVGSQNKVKKGRLDHKVGHDSIKNGFRG